MKILTNDFIENRFYRNHAILTLSQGMQSHTGAIFLQEHPQRVWYARDGEYECTIVCVSTSHQPSELDRRLAITNISLYCLRSPGGERFGCDIRAYRFPRR